MTDTCTTCGEPGDRPYRRYVSDGNGARKLDAGCIDAAHDGVTYPYAAWHNRPEAKQIRKNTARTMP